MNGLPGDERIKVLGFITAEELASFGLKDYVAVYILQSMQWVHHGRARNKRDAHLQATPISYILPSAARVERRAGNSPACPFGVES